MKKNPNICLIMNSLHIEMIRRITEKIESVSRVEVLKHPQTYTLPLDLKKAVFPENSFRQWDATRHTPSDVERFQWLEAVEFQITQCVVMVDRIVGQGLALGDTLEKAYCFAVIDAAIAGNHPMAAEIKKVLWQQELFTEQHPNHRLESLIPMKQMING